MMEKLTLNEHEWENECENERENDRENNVQQPSRLSLKTMRHIQRWQGRTFDDKHKCIWMDHLPKLGR